MSAQLSSGWEERNQQYLVREFAVLRARLSGADPARVEEQQPEPMSPPAAIDRLMEIFELTRFERELVLLCAGVEMDSTLAARCAETSGRPQRGAVTFSLALATLTDPHWSALAPSGPLRRFRLIEIEPGQGLTVAPLHIDERILHFLAGVNHLDSRLESLLHRKEPPERMAAEHRELAVEAIRAGAGEAPPATVLNLCGDDPDGQEDIAALVAHRAERELYVLRHEDTPSAGAELDQFVHLWMREGLLLPAFLLLQWASETPSAPACQLAERMPGALMIASRDPARLHRAVERFDVNKPGPFAQRVLWQEALDSAADGLGEVVDELSEQFRLSAAAIGTISAAVATQEDLANSKGSARLWDSCRAFSRPRLESLAERILPMARWVDLVLPEMQTQMLRQLAAQARHRMTVYEQWGFAQRGRRGLGISALFAGPSGTGKTLAAEVLAAELRLDLYRIDLSSVVSKYIGETEKNLKQVFDAAEAGGVLLLFDEADALFGKRSEVKDSHDRYANIEVGYLLQRMESFQGLAILTSNAKSALDRAFQRRLRFTIDFPFPDAAQREAIWTRVFPAETPTTNLQPRRLAQLNMAGGNIRNIALNAAFLAAEAGTSVDMAKVLQAARMEAVKIERPLTDIEIRGWL